MHPIKEVDELYIRRREPRSVFAWDEGELNSKLDPNFCSFGLLGSRGNTIWIPVTKEKKASHGLVRRMEINFNRTSVKGNGLHCLKAYLTWWSKHNKKVGYCFPPLPPITPSSKYQIGSKTAFSILILLVPIACQCSFQGIKTAKKIWTRRWIQKTVARYIYPTSRLGINFLLIGRRKKNPKLQVNHISLCLDVSNSLNRAISTSL